MNSQTQMQHVLSRGRRASFARWGLLAIAVCFTTASTGCAMVWDPCTRSMRERPEVRVCYPDCGYYGYHPTCWRRWPAGWGCPCPVEVDEEAISSHAEPSLHEAANAPDATEPTPMHHGDAPAAEPKEVEQPAGEDGALLEETDENGSISDELALNDEEPTLALPVKELANRGGAPR